MKAPSIIVAGGTNLDIKSRIAGKAIPGTSNPGWTETSPGGVGRNIAENLARLGARDLSFMPCLPPHWQYPCPWRLALPCPGRLQARPALLF